MANLTSLYTVGVKHHCALAQHHFEHCEKHHYSPHIFLSIFQGEFCAKNLVQKPIEKDA